MGRMSLIIVMGFIIIAGITFVTLNETDLRSTDNTVGNAFALERNFSARDIISYAIQHKVMFDASYNTPDSSWMNCLANVEMEDLNGSDDFPFDSLKFTATAVVDGIQKQIEAIVLCKDQALPVMYSPLVIHANQAGVRLQGPSYINGADVNMDGSAGTEDDKYAITLTKADSTALIADLGDDTTKVFGEGGFPSLDKNVSYHEDIAKYVDLYGTMADTTINTGILPGGIYGSEANPVIVYATGTTIMSGDVTGTGVLAIDGSFSTTDSSTLTWYGLVICSADVDSNNTNLYFADSSSVYGTVIVGAPTKGGVNLKGERVTFTIEDNEVIPGQDFNVAVHVLGSELSGSGGRKDAQCEVKVFVGGSVVKTWSDVRYSDGDAYVDGKWQPPLSSFYWTDPTVYEAGTPVTIQVRFYSTDYYSGINRTISSTTNSDHLHTKRNGDDKPGMAGSSGQSDVESFLEGYITDGVITITDNQAIFLFDYNDISNPFPYDDYWDFREAHDDHWDPYYYDVNPEYEDYVALYGDPNEYYSNYNDFLNSWIDDGISPDTRISEHNVEYEDYEEAIEEWYDEYDTRDFQDAVVLADLSVPEDEEDSLIVTIDSTSHDKTVKLQNSEEANEIVKNMIRSRVGAARTIVKVDWWDKGEAKIEGDNY
ncbi:MAG: hypothetical protein JXQ65_05975 [Candidatus Marinimicrobia bacterium]|nr:hypothetical protein [Candidatus Neomarinimicrobiota bacterium]